MRSDFRRHDPEGERDEIASAIGDSPSASESIHFSERFGRVPISLDRGWQARQRRAESCKLCEGDLWVEAEDGTHQPCECRQRRAERRARNRLRSGNWWRGTSLSFAAPPLALINATAAKEVHRLCDAVVQGRETEGLWLAGGAEQGKSAVCAYFGQRLFPTNKVAVEHLGDLLAHLRWLGGVKGEGAVEEKLHALAEAPLLVIDDIDRPIRTFPVTAPLAMRESATSRDLLRLFGLLDERIASSRPLVVTSRVEPHRCAERTTAFRRVDLVRALLGTATGIADPIEDFPSYTLPLIGKVMNQLQDACRSVSLSTERRAAQAA